MKSRLLLVVAALAAPGQAQLRITVAVNNLAGIHPRMVVHAEEIAGAIFRHAGVEVAWEECSNAEALPAEFRLNLVNGMASAAGRDPAGLGYSARGGTLLYIFRGQLELHDRQIRFVVLGHAIAHELGHLLLGPEHSRHGVMSTGWHAEQIRAASIGRLGFDSDQSRRIRASISGKQRITTAARRSSR